MIGSGKAMVTSISDPADKLTQKVDNKALCREEMSAKRIMDATAA